MSVTSLMERLGRNRFRPQDFMIEPITVALPDLPPAFDGYRIVHLSDLHMGHWMNGERLRGVAALVNQQEPELIAITGDFVSYSIEQVDAELTEGLRRLDARDGVVAVLGNHDHWLDATAVRKILRAGGVRELANTIYTVQRGDAVLHVAGVDDITVGADRLDEVVAQLPAGGPAVLLAHEPDFADVSAATGRFDLQLSGHSHGGQIILRPFGPFRGHLFRRYPIGRYQVGNMVQYTNRGLGTHLLRLRINCPPEITVITLRSPA